MLSQWTYVCICIAQFCFVLHGLYAVIGQKQKFACAYLCAVKYQTQQLRSIVIFLYYATKKSALVCWFVFKRVLHIVMIVSTEKSITSLNHWLFKLFENEILSMVDKMQSTQTSCRSIEIKLTNYFEVIRLNMMTISRFNWYMNVIQFSISNFIGVIYFHKWFQWFSQLSV